MPNPPKGKSYAVAFARIKAAMQAGFPIEAITIQESILSDRIQSHVLGKDKAIDPKKLKSLKNLLERWRDLGGDRSHKGNQDLCEAVDAWRVMRNKAVHALVKSHPGDAPISPEEFLLEAKECAEKGAKLARAVCDWHRAKLNEDRKAASKLVEKSNAQK